MFIKCVISCIPMCLSWSTFWEKCSISEPWQRQFWLVIFSSNVMLSLIKWFYLSHLRTNETVHSYDIVRVIHYNENQTRKLQFIIRKSYYTCIRSKNCIILSDMFVNGFCHCLCFWGIWYSVFGPRRWMHMALIMFQQMYV